MTVRPRSLPVTTAAQASARDQCAIAAGISSFSLMAQAGTEAAAIILREYTDRLADGVALYAGPGNNGGDAYIVAAQLARAGVRVRLHPSDPPRMPDAQRAAAIAAPLLVHGAPTASEQIVVDGVLGTGASGALRGSVAHACERMALARDGGAVVVALDMPTGLDATTGEVAAGSVAAHLTVSFGTFKRAHLIARDHVGTVMLADIGLDGFADADDGAWHLAQGTVLSPYVDEPTWTSHKALRGRIAMVGGTAGMAGALVLSTRAAIASGAGLVHAVVAEQSVPVLQVAVPQVVVHRWSARSEFRVTIDTIAIGPGLGRDDASRKLLWDWLRGDSNDDERAASEGAEAPAAHSFVLDADALTLLAQRAQEEGRPCAELLHELTQSARSVICTPHPGEFARLLGEPLPTSIVDRVDAARSFAARSRAVVLLKGTPTIVAAPDGESVLMVARGTPALATGGSGDLLTGVIAALTAQGTEPLFAAAAGAWVHGVASELAVAQHHSVRGLSLDALIAALPEAWRMLREPAQLAPGILSVLPHVWSHASFPDAR